MAFTSAQRAVYSSILTSQIEKQLVLGNAVNYAYQPDAQFAKSVIINTLGSVTIGDYAAATGLSGSLESVSFTSQTLTLDKQKYFNMYADATLLSATNIDVIANATRNASYGLANAADVAITALYSSFSSASNAVLVGLQDSSTASGSMYDYLVDLSVKLSEANAPMNDRFCAVPFEALGLLSKDSRFTTQNPVILANGVVQGATVAGMQLLATNNLNTTTTTKIMAFQKEAIAFAAGLNSIEAYNPENYFGQAIKGLYIFGVKAVVPAFGIYLPTVFE
jgi:hypothetical protein